MNESEKFRLISIEIFDSILFRKSKQGYVSFSRNQFKKEYYLNIYNNNPKSKCCFNIKFEKNFVFRCRSNINKINLKFPDNNIIEMVFEQKEKFISFLGFLELISQDNDFMFKKPELVLTKKCAKNRHKSILNESCKVDPSDQSKTYLEIFSSSSFKRKIDDSISSEKIINKRIRYEGSEMGFPNLGQSCYMNAILQCLVEMNYFFNHPLRPTKIFDDFSIEKCMFSLIQAIGRSDASEVFESLIRIKETISKRALKFMDNDQHDAHEYLCEVLSQLENVLLDYQYLIKSPIAIFGFKMKQTIKCLICLKECEKYESYNILSLEMARKNTSLSVQKLFEEFLNEEFIDDFKCDNCFSSKHVIKRCFTNLPCIFVLHLKRFELLNIAQPNIILTQTQALTSKISSQVQIPEYLLLKSLMLNQPNQQTQDQSYYLIGIVSHLGDSINSGHYVTEFFNKKSNKWKTYDDNKVESINQNQVFKIRTGTCYILFFIQN